jgi:hypothetical protein
LWRLYRGRQPPSNEEGKSQVGKVEVSNEELRTIRSAMRELNRMVEDLECGASEKYVLTKNGQMRAVVLSVEHFSTLRQTVPDSPVRPAA